MATSLILAGPSAASAEHAIERLRASMHHWPRDPECERSLLVPLVPIDPLPVRSVTDAITVALELDEPTGRHRAPA